MRNTVPAKYTKKSPLSIIILAAGEANRMKSYGPRSLIQINEKQTIIDRQLEIIDTHFSSKEIILVCGHEADKVMNHTPHNIIKVENEKYNETNVARSMALGLRAASTDRVLFIYGDLIFNAATLENANYNKSSVFVEPEEGYFASTDIGCTAPDNQLEHMTYDVPNKWTQITLLVGKELELFKNLVWSRQRDRLFGFEILNEIVSRGGKIEIQKPKDSRVIDIDSSKDLQRISKVI